MNDLVERFQSLDPFLFIFTMYGSQRTRREIWKEGRREGRNGKKRRARRGEGEGGKDKKAGIEWQGGREHKGRRNCPPPLPPDSG